MTVCCSHCGSTVMEMSGKSCDWSGGRTRVAPASADDSERKSYTASRSGSTWSTTSADG